MKTPTEQKFTELINSLESLQHLKPDAAFRKRIKRTIHAQSPAPRFALPFFALRVALVTFLLLTAGTSGFVASEQSKPGEALYPVKQMFNAVQTPFTTETEITTVPSPKTRKIKEKAVIPTVTPEPTVTPTIIKQILPADDVAEPIPTQTPTPTPKPEEQSVLPAVETPAEQVINQPNVGIELPIGGISQPTPTPPPAGGLTIEGSKDNGSNAGAGGSLLPKLKKLLREHHLRS